MININEVASDKLFVVRPSIVTFDNTIHSFSKHRDRLLSVQSPITQEDSDIAKKVGVELNKTSLVNNIKYYFYKSTYELAKERNIDYLIHIVKLETNMNNTTIAVEDSNGLLKDVDSDKIFYQGIGSHACEGDMHVDVNYNDKISLIRYLWVKNISEGNYTYEIERYLLSLKPFYNVEEIMLILGQIKKEVENGKEDNPKELVLKRKRQKPIFVRNIYTDAC
jgi:hypothetical protein